MKAGIISCGAISSIHATVLKKFGIEIKALCDTDLARANSLKEKLGLKAEVFDDYRKLLDCGIDAVHVCAPHHLHGETVIEALKRDIHTLCEKPLCISEEEISQIRTQLGKTRAKLGICFQNRYLDANVAVKQFLENKKIRSVMGTVLWNRDAQYYLSSGWRGKKATEGGGVLINQAIHTLDLMIWFTEMPEYISSNVSNKHLTGVIEVEDTADCYWETSAGTRMMLFATTACSKNYPVNIKFDVEGHNIEILGSTCRIDGRQICEPQANIFETKDYWGIGHYKLIKDFYRCIEEGSQFPIGFEEGIKALKTVLACYRSNGERVKV